MAKDYIKIFISAPTMGKVHTFLMDRIISWTVNQNFQKEFYWTVNVSPVDKAREQIVDEFIKSSCTHLFMVDSDTIPPVDVIDKLLAMNVDIATALTPMIRYSKDAKDYIREYNAVGLDTKHLSPDTGIKECLGAGGSCLLIKREAVLRIPRPLFRNVWEDDLGNKNFISEDIYFITKARKHGFKTFADTSLIALHEKSVIW